VICGLDNPVKMLFTVWIRGALGSADKAGLGIGPREIVPSGGLRRKRVGFVLEPADRDPRHPMLFLRLHVPRQQTQV
jgi:hypothetical protein